MKKHVFMLCLGLLTAPLAVGNPSPYINKVYEFVPAPGQFVGAAYPAYSEGETEADVLRRVDSLLVGEPGINRMISLGAWGGYVTFGFDHPVVNVPGEYDLRVHGNAFVNPPVDGVQYGSCEPGIVYVSQDANGDGLPNDTWYELAGSESARTIRRYEVTYFSDEADVPWQDNMGNADFIYRNVFHQQRSYYPLWRTDDEYTLTGSLLPSNVNPDNRQSYPFAYGYVDVWPNSDERSALKLDWAIDADGASVLLTHIDFVRVQTGVMMPRWGNGGLNGEMSTEVTGAEDLHPEAPYQPESVDEHYVSPCTKRLVNSQILLLIDGQTYTVLGQRL